MVRAQLLSVVNVQLIRTIMVQVQC